MAAPEAWLGDGGYARVLALSPARVVKLTSCTATVALLDALALQTRAQRRASALPAVFRCYGPVAVDADGQTFHGYELERLFAPGQLAAMRTARACGDETPPERRITFAARHATQTYRRFQQVRVRFEHQQTRYIRGKQPAWQECLALAGALASERDAFGTEDAFGWLERFVDRHRVELDLLSRGNLLMSAWGTPVLADPVAVQAFETPERGTEPDIDAAASSAFAVLIERVQACHGFEVQVRWHTEGPFDTLAAAQARRDAVLRPGTDAVNADVVPWRSKAHRQRMHAHPVRCVPLWNLPSGARATLAASVRSRARER
jgi:hypothetical protein